MHNLAFQHSPVPLFNPQQQPHHLSPTVKCCNHAPVPAHQTVKPKFTLFDRQYFEKPDLVSANDFARLVVLSDNDLPQVLAIASSDERYNSGLEMRLVHISQHHHRNDNNSLPITPIHHTVSFHRSIPEYIRKLRSRRAKRFHLQPESSMLMYSSMVWTCPKMFAKLVIPNPETPPWVAFIENQVYLSRAVYAVHYGTCPQVALAFGFQPSTLMWSRDVILSQDGKPFLYCHQIISPRMEDFIGSMKPSHPYPTSQPFPSLIYSTSLKVQPVQNCGFCPEEICTSKD